MIILSFPLPAKPLNLNDRDHWAVKAARTRLWRRAAELAARNDINRGDITRHQPFSIVQLSLPVKSLNVRRDPSNWAATTKPCVDGIVDAELLRDDSSAYCATMEPRFHEAKRDPQVSILIRPATVDGVL